MPCHALILHRWLHGIENIIMIFFLLVAFQQLRELVAQGVPANLWEAEAPDTDYF